MARADERADDPAAWSIRAGERPRLLERLWAHGHAAYVVGGSRARRAAGRPADDWDLATDARPDRLLAVFPGAVYENKFGTVAVREGDAVARGHDVPHRPRLRRLPAAASRRVRRRRRGRPRPPGLHRQRDRLGRGGRRQAARASRPPGDRRPVRRRRRRRGAGPPRRRRARGRASARTRCGCSAPSASRPSSTSRSSRDARGDPRQRALAAHVSGERVAAELGKLLAAPRPSIGLRLLAESGLLAVLLPELAAQRGVPQNKIHGEDLWDHTLRTVDAAPRRPAGRPAGRAPPRRRQARDDRRRAVPRPRRGRAPSMAEALLDRLHLPARRRRAVVHLVRTTCSRTSPSGATPASGGSSSASGRDAIDDLFALREADNVGSGVPADAHALAELRARVDAEIAASVVLDLLAPGDPRRRPHRRARAAAGPAARADPRRLLDRVIADPSSTTGRRCCSWPSRCWPTTWDR